MQKRSLHNSEIYHIYNRGVDKRTVFFENNEYLYFIHLLYKLNSSTKIQNTKRKFFKYKTPDSWCLNTINERGSTSLNKMSTENNNRLVDILAFVLMPNHYHLLLRQNEEGGVSKFMQKLGTGYTMLFNEKYKRNGSLFQGRFKSVHIETDSQLLYIPHYIHLNPLSLMTFKNADEGLEQLSNYTWSSFPDYINKKNFPSVTNRGNILSLFGDSQKYLKDIFSFIGKNDAFSNFDSSDLIDFEINERGSTSLIIENSGRKEI